MPDGARAAGPALAQATEPFKIGAIADAGGEQRLEQPAELVPLAIGERGEHGRDRGAAGEQDLVEDAFTVRRQPELQAAAATAT